MEYHLSIRRSSLDVIVLSFMVEPAKLDCNQHSKLLFIVFKALNRKAIPFNSISIRRRRQLSLSISCCIENSNSGSERERPLCWLTLDAVELNLIYLQTSVVAVNCELGFNSVSVCRGC